MSEATIKVAFTLMEVCERTHLPEQVLIDIVEEGVLEPEGQSPSEWRFDSYMLTVCQRAARLHRDFDIDWSGIPLCLDMIAQLESLREENKKLRRQLSRFLLEED